MGSRLIRISWLLDVLGFRGRRGEGGKGSKGAPKGCSVHNSALRFLWPESIWRVQVLVGLVVFWRLMGSRLIRISWLLDVLGLGGGRGGGGNVHAESDEGNESGEANEGARKASCEAWASCGDGGRRGREGTPF